MPSVTFSLLNDSYLRGRNTMEFFAEITANGVLQPNCGICASPVNPTASDLILDISLVGVSGFGTDFTITCTVTNNTGFDVFVTLTPGDITWNGPNPITWNSLTDTILAGGTQANITGQSDGNSLTSGQVVSIAGFVTATSVPPGDGPWTSNSDSDSYTEP